MCWNKNEFPPLQPNNIRGEGEALLAGGVLPADLHTVGLCQADGEQQGHPEDSTLGLDLLEVANCWACNMKYPGSQAILPPKNLSNQLREEEPI